MHRYTDLELEDLVNYGESDRLDFKSDISGSVKTKICEAICAFSNDLPGHGQAGLILVGVEDNGNPTGLPITDELLLNLADIHSAGRILPLPTMTVEKRQIKGTDVAVIAVMPSNMPPVRFEGRILIRVGPRRAVASEDEERILIEKRRHHTLPYDIHPVYDAELADLSRSHFEYDYLPASFAPDVLEANHRSYEERLASCRFIVAPDNPVPTVLGLLALGHDPQRFIPGAAIQFLRIDGIHLEDPVIDELRATGTLVNMIRRILDKMEAHNRTSVDARAQPHIVRSQYPPVAYQQLLYNAVMHRNYERTNSLVRIFWYNDRIEIHSPGGPYGNVNISNFGQPGITDYRNPNLADVLKTYGFVQSFGRGIAMARSALSKNGNPELEINRDQNTVVCILREGKHTVIITVGSTEVIGAPNWDATVIVKEGIVLFPIQPLIRSTLNGETSFGLNTQTLTANALGHSLELTIGSIEALFDGEIIDLATAPTLDSRTGYVYAPARNFLLMMGVSVISSAADGTITLDIPLS